MCVKFRMSSSPLTPIYLSSLMLAKLINIYGKTNVNVHILDKYQEINVSLLIREKTFVQLKGFK